MPAMYDLTSAKQKKRRNTLQLLEYSRYAVVNPVYKTPESPKERKLNCSSCS